MIHKMCRSMYLIYISINKQKINWMLNKFQIQGVKGSEKSAIKTVKVANNVLDDNKRAREKKEENQNTTAD